VSFDPQGARTLHRPVDSVELVSLGAASVRFVAPGSITSGRFGLFRWDMEANAGGPSPHFHKTFSESFYVLSGTVRLGDGQRWWEATAGDYLYVPEGAVHAFENDSDERASMLILFAPGAPRERYFEELAELATTGRQLSDEEWVSLYARHDQYMV
jgi:quercetin dioxygenase-like cupin family protein